LTIESARLTGACPLTGVPPPKITALRAFQ
jgi:hypothetical protein